MSDLKAVYAAVDRDTAVAVEELINSFGVPASLEQADALASELFPAVVQRRQAVFAAESAGLVTEHPDLVIAKQRPYRLPALQKLVRRCAGLGQKPQLAQLELFDPATVNMQSRRVAPAWMPHEPEVILEMQRRLTAGVARHTKQVGRDAIFDTARRNGVMYARQLSGKENCAFCAMLASRGAVYATKQGAGGNGNFFHDHCDCRVVIVRDPNNWAGKHEADRLYRMWRHAGSTTAFGQAFRAEQGALA
ncbi:VG15 protein [Corynebacterium gerontici]|uniref:Phage Mu protein F like protein n=1 Tax=Corynebacterium gerontici TaxID=2079234 RepID=A0A3G6IZ70_9CORY|nr:hypothetical protein [Corynebacterium gerontici]AZA11085.1 hypothetical protein CGERO_03840 [Corynebacterium gerontici]